MAVNSIFQVALEVIEDINPVNTNTLKLCLPFDDTVGESYTLDGSPTRHPIDMTTETPTIRSDPNGFDPKFGGGAVELGAGGDFVRVMLPQPDFNFDGDFTIEFWLFRISPGAQEDVMGQWPEDSDHPSPSTDLGWRIKLFGSQLHFEWTSDGSTVNTEVAFHNVAFQEWEHLAFENFGGIFTIYSNGTLVYNTASFVPIHRSVEDFLIGKADRYGTGGDGNCDCNIDELKIVVGEATFKKPFIKPIASVDCISIVTPPDVNWTPDNLGEQVECSDSEFTIEISGLETVLGTQILQATGLPTGMVIDNFGNIIGVLPIHTAPPTIMNYEFQVTLFNNGVPILGPDTFSFDVRDQYSNDILQVTVPVLYEANDRTLWKQHLLALISNDDLYRATDPAFGITFSPDLFIIDGLTEDDLTAFQTALAREDGKGPEKHNVVIKTLAFGTTTNADVLFYTIEDTGSDILSFANPLNVARDLAVVPDPIEPISIDNIRDLLKAGVGFDSQFAQEKIPDFLGDVYQPIVVAAFVSKGIGQIIVNKFNDDAVHHVFKGKTITLDRINIKRCATIWDENGGPSILVKFDDI